MKKKIAKLLITSIALAFPMMPIFEYSSFYGGAYIALYVILTAIAARIIFGRQV